VALGAEELPALLRGTPALAGPLQALARLALPDAWIGAGFLRNAVWEVLHGRSAALLPQADLDVVFFDPAGRIGEAAVEAALRDLLPLPWSARNQARMHRRNGDAPYADTADALRHWPETATAVAARWQPEGVEILAPWGLADLLGLVLRPSPACAAQPRKRGAMAERIASRGWLRRWPGLRVEGLDTPG
jgi:hypothetical protein